MWKIQYCPPTGQNRSPYEEILEFGNKDRAYIFGKLQLNAERDEITEWVGSLKPIIYKKKKWFQLTIDAFRVSMIIDRPNKILIILHVFRKKSNETKLEDKNRTYDNLIYWESEN